MRYSDSSLSNSSAATFGGSLQAERDLGRVDGFASFASFGSGLWSTQGSLHGSLNTPQFGKGGAFSGEISVSGAGVLQNNNAHTGQLLGMLRGHLSSLHAGLWLGGGGGTVEDGFGARSMICGDLGIWTRQKVVTLVATVNPTSVGNDLHYTDVEGRVDLEVSKLDLSASIGTRSGATWTTQSGSKSWGNASATFWFLPRLGVNATAGSYPYDAAQGYPGGKYVAMSLKFRSKIPARKESHTASAKKDPLVTQAPAYVVAVDSSKNEKILRINADNASSVEVMGDFTNWQPVTLRAAQQPGWWELEAPLASGLHYMNFRADGSHWRVPSGMGVTKDEFNGEVGILIVP